MAGEHILSMALPPLYAEHPNYDAMQRYCRDTLQVRDERVLKGIGELKKLKQFLSDGDAQPDDPYLYAAKRYLQLFMQAQLHLPLNDGSIPRVQFRWRPVGEGHMTSACSWVEVGMTLVTVGHAQWAAGVSHAGQGGIAMKDAFKCFQLAAGYYEAAAEAADKLTPLDRKGTLERQNLQYLIKLAMAVAHHTAYLAATVSEASGQKHSFLAKAAVEGIELYNEQGALQLATPGAREAMNEFLTFARATLTARAHRHMVDCSRDGAQYGAAIAHCTKAVHALSDRALSRRYGALVKDRRAEAEALLRDLQRENETIYFDTPKEVSLPARLGKAYGKPVREAPFFSLEYLTQDNPFFGVVSPAVRGKANSLKEEMRTTFTNLCKSLSLHREKTQATMSQLGVSSMLPLAGGADGGKAALPELLRGRILAIQVATQEKGVLRTLVERTVSLSDQFTSQRQRLEGASKMLDDEATEHDTLSDIYTEHVWAQHRHPSASMPVYRELRVVVAAAQARLASEAGDVLDAVKHDVQSNSKLLSRLDMAPDKLDELLPQPSLNARQIAEKMKAGAERLGAKTKRMQLLDDEINLLCREVHTFLGSDNIMLALSRSPETEHTSVCADSTAELSGILGKIRGKMNDIDGVLLSCEEDAASMALLKSGDTQAEQVQQFVGELEKTITLYQARLVTQLDGASAALTTMQRHVEAVHAEAMGYVTARRAEANEVISRITARRVEQLNVSKHEELTACLRRQDRMRKYIGELERQLAEATTVS